MTALEASFELLAPGACSSDLRSLLLVLERSADKRSSHCTRCRLSERGNLWADVATAIAQARAALAKLSIGEPAASLSFKPLSTAQRDALIAGEGSSPYERPQGGQHAAVLP